MEDIIYLLIMAVVMIAGAVSSSNKKKKQQREASSRKVQQPQQAGEEYFPAPEKNTRKTISEILEELAAEEDDYEDEGSRPYRAEEYTYTYETPEPFYPAEETITPSIEEVRVSGGRTADSTFLRAEKIVAPEITHTEEIREADSESRTLSDILGGEFDLRRAVIESEILNPKYKQY